MKPITLNTAPPRHRRLGELLGFLLLLTSVLLLLGLVSYRPTDPSLDTAGPRVVHHRTRPLGAI